MTELGDRIDALEALLAEREGEVQALVPEGGRFDRLRAAAARLVERWPKPEARPPLFGLLVGVKDVFHVDGLPTTGGSRLPPAELAGPQAAAVTALLDAGALVLGKTVSTEFAYFAPGPTRNPRRLQHTPGGSSSGSAAAVAAGYCPLALGTQTIGSIARPAAFCGVVGYKPSYERISRDGVIPLSPSLDHVGTFTRDVALAGRAAAVLVSDWRPEPVGSGERPVLGIPEGPYLEQASEAALTHFRTTCRTLQAAGCTLRPVPALQDLVEVRERHGRIVAAEAARVHERWFPRFASLYHPRTAELIERGRQVQPDQLRGDLDGRQRLRRQLEELRRREGIDLWVSPAALGPAPRGLDSTGDPAMNLPWTHAGLPTLALPAGEDAAGLPLGLQLTAPWWADEALLAWGGKLEEMLR